jgi:hypothetical protein
VRARHLAAEQSADAASGLQVFSQNTLAPFFNLKLPCLAAFQRSTRDPSKALFKGQPVILSLDVPMAQMTINRSSKAPI